LTWYLNSTLDLYKKAQDTVQTRLSGAKSAVSNPLDFVRNLLSGQPSPPSTSDSGEVEQLRRRVEELQARLEKSEKPPDKPPRRATSRKRATK